MNTPVFPKLDEQILNEYAKDSDNPNYEAYTGIILDPEDNIFKTISGHFTDKKDFYEKLTARGYIVRKVFEKKVFDWIEKNAKDTLEAYLMFSTAFSKWKGNNMLNSYYTKLLNDIPQLNRERVKGNPNTKGSAKESINLTEEDDIRRSYLQYSGDNPEGSKMKVSLIPIAKISKKINDIDTEVIEQPLNKEASFDKYKFTIPQAPIDNEKTLAEFLKSNDKFILDASQEMLKPKYDEEGRIINGAKADPSLLSDKYPIDKYLVKINDRFVTDKNQKPIEIKKVSFLNWKDNLMTSSGEKAKMSNSNLGLRNAGIIYNQNRQKAIDTANLFMGDYDRYDNTMKASEKTLNDLKFNLNQRIFNDPKWVLGISNQNLKPVNLTQQINALRSNGVIRNSQDSYEDKIESDQLKYNELKQDKAIISNGKKGSKEVEEVYEKYGIDSNSTTSNIDILTLINNKMQNILHDYDPLSAEAQKNAGLMDIINKKFNNMGYDTAQAAYDKLVFDLHATDDISLGSDEKKNRAFKARVLRAALDQVLSKKPDSDNTDSKPNEKNTLNKKERALTNQKLTLQKAKDLLAQLNQVKQDDHTKIKNMVNRTDTSDIENKIKNLEASIEQNEIELANLKNKKSTNSNKEKTDESFVDFIKSLKEEHIPVVDDPTCVKYVNYNATQSYANQPVDGVITNPGAIPTSGQYMYEEDQGTEQWGWAHTELNQELFDGTRLKSDVREALLKIAEKFETSLGINLKPVDVYFTGSSANYNYNDASDIDLHLVYDFEEIGINAEILIKYFIAKKQVFNNDYNITVKNIPVEVGVENLNDPIVASAVYSLTKDSWLLEPGYANRLLPQIDMHYYYDLVQKIEDAIETHDSKEIGKVWDKLYEIRKKSLANEGEYGKGNAIFKKLRNLGYLDRLKKAYYSNASEELSLESLKEI